MRRARLLTNYDRVDDFSLSTLAGRTLGFMTGNAHFVDAKPTLEEYTIMVTDYRDKHEVASKRGSLLELKAKDNARAVLIQGMRELTFFINTVAAGNPEILASSGFELAAEPKSSTYPGVPGNLRITDGRVTGEVKFAFGALRNAWEYEYAYATEVNGNNEPIWGEVFRTTNSRSSFIAGLEQGIRLYLRVRARNGVGIGDWTQPVSLIVR